MNYILQEERRKLSMLKKILTQPSWNGGSSLSPHWACIPTQSLPVGIDHDKDNADWEHVSLLYRISHSDHSM